MRDRPTPAHDAAPHDDLEALRRSESAPAEGLRRSWLPRLVGALLVLGLLGAAWALLQPVLFPPPVVRLAGVRVVEGSARPQGRVQAQAAGWIEAAPFPVSVRPLVAGVVESLHVLEGQTVVAGETLIARLRNADLENALILAEAAVVEAEAARGLAAARLAANEAILDQRLEPRDMLARRKGELATARAARTEAQAQVARARAALATARVDLDAFDELEAAGSATPLALRRARAHVEEARASAEAAEASVARAEAEVARLDALVAIAQEGVDDPRGLEGRVAEDRQALARAEAALAAARAEHEVAERNVGMLTVHAPVDGIVLRLESAPGAVAGPRGEMRGGGEEGTGSTGRLDAMSGALVSLYDPSSLQARVDVQLSDVAGIGAGTAVELEAPALRGRTFAGEVIRLQHEADLLKNTLQVKVEILEPDPLLRPEMLVTARFLAPPREADDTEGGTLQAVVPSEAVRDGAVMIYDPTGGGRARRVPVEVLSSEGAETVVEGPLGPGHKVILDAVEDGQAVRRGS